MYVGGGVQCIHRSEKGLGLGLGLGLKLGLQLGLGLGLGELEEKWREKDKKVKKIQQEDKMFLFDSK